MKIWRSTPNIYFATTHIEDYDERSNFKEIASQVQLFKHLEQKETFIFVVGALASRLISLHKAAEIMHKTYAERVVAEYIAKRHQDIIERNEK